jgi:hypothetical protein
MNESGAYGVHVAAWPLAGRCTPPPHPHCPIPTATPPHPTPDPPPPRLSKGQIYTQIDAIMNQYDMEDFDLGIKQFMIEQAIQQEMEEGLDKKVGPGGRGLQPVAAPAPCDLAHT